MFYLDSDAFSAVVQPEHSVSKVGTSSTKLSNAKVSAHSLLCKSSHGLVVFNPSSSAAEGHPRIIQSVGSSFSDFATRSTILKTGAKQVTGLAIIGENMIRIFQSTA